VPAVPEGLLSNSPPSTLRGDEAITLCYASPRHGQLPGWYSYDTRTIGHVPGNDGAAPNYYFPADGYTGEHLCANAHQRHVTHSHRSAKDNPRGDMHEIADVAIVINRASSVYHAMDADMCAAVDHSTRHYSGPFSNCRFLTHNRGRMDRPDISDAEVTKLLPNAIPKTVIANAYYKSANPVPESRQVCERSHYLFTEQSLPSRRRVIVYYSCNLIFMALMDDINNDLGVSACAINHHVFHGCSVPSLSATFISAGVEIRTPGSFRPLPV